MTVLETIARLFEVSEIAFSGATVPEPDVLGLVGLGLLASVMARRRAAQRLL